jgi:hypothetical protein
VGRREDMRSEHGRCVRRVVDPGCSMLHVARPDADLLGGLDPDEERVSPSYWIATAISSQSRRRREAVARGHARTGHGTSCGRVRLLRTAVESVTRREIRLPSTHSSRLRATSAAGAEDGRWTGRRARLVMNRVRARCPLGAARGAARALGPIARIGEGRRPSAAVRRPLCRCRDTRRRTVCCDNPPALRR